jgi:NarL family two-component system response regulator YdfI
MNQLHILVMAALSARRVQLAQMAAKAAKARITTAGAFPSEGIDEAGVDILLVDVHSLEAASSVLRMMANLSAGTGVVVLTDNPDSHWVQRAVSAGVNAILSREITADDLHLAVLAAEAGLILLHPTSALGLVPQTLQQSPEPPDAVEQLTTREQQVLRLMSEGLGNKEIATRLNISDHTVKFHISSILGKLSAASRTEAVSLGIRRGIIPI